MFELPAMPAAARSLAFNPEGSLLAALCQDRVLRLIDTEAIRYAYEAPCDGHAITFDANGTRLGPVFRGDEPGSFTLSGPDEFKQSNVANTRIEFDACLYSPDSADDRGRQCNQCSLL